MLWGYRVSNTSTKMTPKANWEIQGCAKKLLSRHEYVEVVGICLRRAQDTQCTDQRDTGCAAAQLTNSHIHIFRPVRNICGLKLVPLRVSNGFDTHSKTLKDGLAYRLLDDWA